MLILVVTAVFAHWLFPMTKSKCRSCIQITTGTWYRYKFSVLYFILNYRGNGNTKELSFFFEWIKIWIKYKILVRSIDLIPFQLRKFNFKSIKLKFKGNYAYLEKGWNYHFLATLFLITRELLNDYLQFLWKPVENNVHTVN